MSVSVPVIISALAMKPMPPMLARSIANRFASLAAEAATTPEATEGADATAGIAAAAFGEYAPTDIRLDTRV